MSCKGNCKCECKTAIIFGITGQDGSHLTDFLLQNNYRVIGVVRRSSTDTTGRIKHALSNPKLKIVDGDVTDYSSILKIFNNYAPQTGPVCEVYNLAAQSHVAVSFQQPGLTWDITGKGCLNILQAIVDLNLVNRVKFYQASSSEMFGKNYDIKDGKKIQSETTRFLPQSPYAIAKCAAHEAVRLYREAYGIHASAGILFNHEGPRRGDNFVTRKITKWIGEFRRWKNAIDSQQHDYTSDPNFLLKLSPVSLGGSGNITDKFPKLRLGNLEAFRDWGYAGNYVEAMWMMLQQEIPDDYVICTGETHTIREFLDVAFDLIGIKDWSNYVVQDKEFYRPAEVDYLLGDNTKAVTKLGWTPKTSFKELVTTMVAYDIG
jgi:GDPmannose 4,6-dehydratase